MRAVTAEQKQQILQLANDFPRLWAETTTTPRDRKRILRLLVRDITVMKGPEPKTLGLHIRWQGGETETLRLQLPQNRAEAIRYSMAFVNRIRELAADHRDDDIVAALRTEGQKSTTTGKPITLGTIKWLRYKYRIPAPPPPKGTLNVRQVRERYGVSLWVVHYWIEHGIVPAVHRKPNAPYAITIDNALDRRAVENGSPTRPIFIYHPTANCMRCIMPVVSKRQAACARRRLSECRCGEPVEAGIALSAHDHKGPGYCAPGRVRISPPSFHRPRRWPRAAAAETRAMRGLVDLLKKRREPGMARSSRRHLDPVESGWQRCPALCPVSRLLARVVLGSRPFLRRARFLRPHHRYYTSIRHPASPLMAPVIPRHKRPPATFPGGRNRASWVPTRSLPA